MVVSNFYTTNPFNTSGYQTVTASDLTACRYYDRDLSYESAMSQVSDERLPVIDSDSWSKISEMLESSDIELIKLGFQLLSGYRFPKGIINLTIIHNAINKYLKEINK